MIRHWLAVLALIASLGLATPKLMADHGQGKGNPHGKKHADNDHGRWEARNGYEYRTFERDGRPPGWNRGKKTGWGNCGLPPGQAKKYGACRMYVYDGRPHYYYQDERGQIFVRRPIVEVHAGVDIVR